MIKYAWFPEIKYDKELGHYHTYGIAAFDGKKKRMISDVSTDKEAVCALVSNFNSGRLGLEHIDEAVENFLYDHNV